ncbi:phenylacetic acid degradation bifunctional protein PaaZ [Dasania sp. GY-MA-18]|uniref:Phenylacetic acid degradation bifunctional protein PaaZ n=1 Tax=Dasania phycosphaerae TaxID=2950436 RepID=A0A9J6RRC3_9GAMM|nr:MULTISPECIES: phenylacetic acid degradation bifunctional protein PaaZ [Dasania]MCR8924456.1 phenylacetic acid degradation bifunctional protein PaaZ [Dasania sp. GY-MA-18]MCZ0867131.1 phenylacetic acid degradation bifunctional protein PaaZ [Dasania phycosphaerae]MCZ0870583.1 phenylacetic acid degradation bifunctional protein PaaZ [Dasania phycosphaerae]
MKLQSYIAGQWLEGQGQGVEVLNAVNGELVAEVSSAGIDFKAALEYGRNKGGAALRAMTFHERANKLKALAQHLMAKKEEFYRVSAWTGATRADSWVDIEGGLGTVFTYASLARREFANETFLVEGPAERLSKNGTFIGRHILVPKEGVSVHINAFNFPCWGMLEKIAPSLIAGVPVIVKPATVSSYLTQVMVKEIIDSGILPDGAIQLICGNTGDLLDHLNEQDVVTFTGSASTGRMLKTHPNIVANSIPFTMEADSLNCSILGAGVEPGTPEFDLYIKGVAAEMTVKAGQKCTAIRRAIIPSNRVEAVSEALQARLNKATLGDPAVEGVRMGPLVGRSQMKDVWDKVAQLKQSCELVYGGTDDFTVQGGDKDKGAYFPATLLYCDKPLSTETPHAVEAFGPVSTLMPYDSIEDAITLAKLGRGSLAASIVTADDAEATKLVLGTAAYHGRILVLNQDCAKESTGHGSPLPQLVHGGPGRAGGGEELGGARAVKHYMQRTAIQGSPTTLTAVTKEFNPGSKQITSDVHPFRRYFEELQIGETLITHRRTLTEADVVNFGCVSGDHFYAHFDEVAAKDSFFGKRVAHGYLVLSAAAGMFVDPAPGPVIANYGLENLRFIEPVAIGDTIQARLTCKQKIKKDRRPDEDRATGVVEWDIEVINQRDETVAVYSIMTLVERREE